MADRNPHRCVIDRNGYYVTFVLLVEQANGDAAPYAYTLKEGEALIEASPPSNMITPRWTGTAWVETATPEEIEAAKPEPLPPAAPSELDILREEVDAALMELAGGLAEQEAVNQEQDNAIMEIGGMIGG